MASHRVMCAWCHQINHIGLARCWNCGHRPGAPRMECDCDRCKATPLFNVGPIVDEYLRTLDGKQPPSNN